MVSFIRKNNKKPGTMINKFKYRTFEEKDFIEFKNDSMEFFSIELVLSHYTGEPVGFVATSTNSRFYCVCIKVYMDDQHSLWSILPVKDRDNYIDYRSIFDESMKNKKMWIALVSSKGELDDLGVIYPTEMSEYLYSVQ